MSKPRGLTRRQLFGGLFERSETAPRAPAAGPSASQALPRQPLVARPNVPGNPTRARSFPIIRPPGAVDEATFLSRCTKCNECVDACPHDAITHAPERFRGAAGTPMIDPGSAPCRMCTDVPCIPACPEEALLPVDIWPIAQARVLDYNCLAKQGSFCTVCSEQCPVPGAITLERGLPTIQNEACTGCGICHFACPAPTNAIAVLPLALHLRSNPGSR